MVRYKGRRMSRNIGILPSRRNGTFIIHEYNHWTKPYEKTLEWIVAKGFTSKPVFIEPGFGGTGYLKKPLADNGALYNALMILNRRASTRQNDISVPIHANRPTDYHEYWIEKNESETGKKSYAIYYDQTDKVPFEVLTEHEFILDYVITQPLSTVTVGSKAKI